jgi:hypothetical protein
MTAERITVGAFDSAAVLRRLERLEAEVAGLKAELARLKSDR